MKAVTLIIKKKGKIKREDERIIGDLVRLDEKRTISVVNVLKPNTFEVWPKLHIAESRKRLRKHARKYSFRTSIRKAG